jgi:hypothetical protein
MPLDPCSKPTPGPYAYAVNRLAPDSDPAMIGLRLV